jgi:hypothetical protein
LLARPIDHHSPKVQTPQLNQRSIAHRGQSLVLEVIMGVVKVRHGY